MKPLEGVAVQKMGVDKSEEEIRFEGGSILVLINTKRSSFWPSFSDLFPKTFLHNGDSNTNFIQCDEITGDPRYLPESHSWIIP